MAKVMTEGWVLVSGDGRKSASLQKKTIVLDDIADHEVLVRPLYGCMEGNFVHALRLKPDNIFNIRNEDEIVLGNAGVVQIESVGSKVSHLSEGDICLYFCNGLQDDYGYPKQITAFDKPNSMGVFAKRIKLDQHEVIKIPSNSKLSLQEWAAFSLKYMTAWSNWNTAYACWKAQMAEVPPEQTFVFGWGGGVTFGELTLAKHMGCTCFMMTSNQERLEVLRNYGINGVDRNQFADSEAAWVEFVHSATEGRGASIFIDNIGQSVYRLTMKGLGRQGVIATSGWKTGSMLPVLRANECQQRHIHVFTHYAGYHEGLEAIQFAESHHWAPPISGEEYAWEEIPSMLEDYEQGRITSWFPIFRINERGS